MRLVLLAILLSGCSVVSVEQDSHDDSEFKIPPITIIDYEF